jgi:PKD repeat protein
MAVTNGDIDGTNGGPISYAGQKLPAGNWVAQTKLTLDQDNEWQYGALAVHVDDNNYTKLAFTENSTGGRFVEFWSETNGSRTTHVPNTNLPATFPTTIHLRLSGNGAALTAAWSQDGQSWTTLGATAPQRPGGTLGMVAAGDTDAYNKDATFDWFRVTPDGGGEDPGFDDTFDGSAIDGCRWNRIVGYESDRVSVADGSLSIETFNADINGGNNGPIENLILQQPPEGDWTVETKMTAPLADNWQLAGLMLYSDDDHYVKYDIVADNNAGSARDLRVELRKEEGGPLSGTGQPDPDPPASASNTWWLRLTKTGNTYTGAISADGVTWHQTAGSVTAALDDPGIGLMAIGPSQESPITVDFDHFRVIENAAPEISSVSADPSSGFAPHAVRFGVEAADADEDELTYSWDFDGDGTADSTAQNPSHTYTTPGSYRARVTVSDGVDSDSGTVDVTVLEAADPGARFRALVFSKTAGFRHSSIDEGHAAIEALGGQHAFQVDRTEDATVFRSDVLREFDTVVFLSTTGDVLNDAQQAAFEAYVRGGGGYAGIHSASDTEYGWDWYGELVGAYFRNHPANQTATVRVEDGSHPSTEGLPASYPRLDEWYNFRSPDFETVGNGDYSPRGSVHVLENVDESTYNESDGNATDDDHPVTWCRRFDGGRSWYTAMGHVEASFDASNPQNILRQILGGLETTAGVEESRECGVWTGPTVEAVASPESGSAPLVVRFSANVSEPDGDRLRYEWDFGDGAARSFASRPRHTYTRPGKYTASVTVTDRAGKSDTDEVEITVTGR